MKNKRNNDKQSFYKHTTIDTAKIILKDRILRWSHPSLLNDPFDIPQRIIGEIDQDSLRIACADQFIKLISNPILPNPEHLCMMTKIVIKTLSKADFTLKKEIIAEIKKYLSEPVIASNTLDSLRGIWQSIYEEHRILCFTEQWDSASMWDRYSDGHHGVLLEFTYQEYLDSVLRLAKPVNYSNDPILYDTLEGYAELLLYEPDYMAKKIFDVYAHTKTTDWENEKEWRIATWKRPHEKGKFSDWGFFIKELQGITFGALISNDDLSDIKNLVKTLYPHVKLWQATIESGRHLIRKELPPF